MTDIQTWLDTHGLGKYAGEFIAQDVSVDLLPELTDADLRELGMASLGDRKRLLKAVQAHSAAVARVPAMPPPPAAAAAVVSAVPVTGVAHGEGERRHATVMFSDLTGYTALNEAFDPEEVEEIMARIKREASAVIERHGGRVNQFVGDEVMAMFGIPVARRDDPRRAVRAALELHQVVDNIAAGLSARLGRVLSMHSGIQTGLVIARRSDSRSGDFTLTGDTVNTAARLRGLAQPGEVVVSPQTWQQVSDYFDAQAGKAIEVKGKERPLVPYRILGERAVPKAGSRPLVGRVEEMQQFAALTEACLQRQRGRVVFVRGDPGLGKSRLVAEFLHVAREQGLVCHAATILDFGARTGHDAVRMLVQSLLGLAPDADEASRADSVREVSGRHPGAGGDPGPFLYDLLDVAAPSEVRSLLSAIDVVTRQKSTLDALCHLATPEPGAAPMLLLVEDIHWADAWTLKQVGALAALAARHPVLVMLTTRFAGDPSVGEWRTSLHGLPVTSIDLGPLAPEDALRLAAGAATISDALLRGCVERAEGNPLFLEQLLLNAGDESATSLPGSIQALIQARMDRLDALDKNALQAAAVWGQRVPLEAVRHLLAEPAYDPRVLVEQFLLRPEGEDLVFSHALFRDGAYGSLLHARRRQLHLLAAQWVEPRDVALAAEHYERAEDEHATTAYLNAAEQRAAAFQYAQALALVERGLRLVRDGASGFALRLARARLLLETGQVAESIAASGGALDAAQSGAERALALIAMASGLRIVDRPAEGLELLQEAQPLAEQAGLTLELSRLHELRGNLLFGVGRSMDCLREHELALQLARQAGSAEAEAAALGGIGDAVYAQGRVRSASDAFGRCIALARAQGNLRIEVAYLAMAGWCAYYMMDIRASVAACNSVIALAGRIMHRRGEMLARAQLAMVDGWVRGHGRTAGEQLDTALGIAQALGSSRFEAMNWLFRTMLALRAGDLEAARGHLETTRKVGGEGGMQFFGAQLYGIQARIASDPQVRRASLASGEAMVEAGTVSHGGFIFCESAIQVSLDTGDLDEARRYCALLERLTSAEPFPWADFVVARGRALARAARGETGAALVAELHALLQRAQAAEAQLYMPHLEAALQRLGEAPA